MSCSPLSISVFSSVSCASCLRVALVEKGRRRGPTIAAATEAGLARVPMGLAVVVLLHLDTGTARAATLASDLEATPAGEKPDLWLSVYGRTNSPSDRRAAILSGLFFFILVDGRDPRSFNRVASLLHLYLSSTVTRVIQQQVKSSQVKSKSRQISGSEPLLPAQFLLLDENKHVEKRLGRRRSL